MSLGAMQVGVLIILGNLLSPSPISFGQKTTDAPRRPVTVADSIRMTRVGEPHYVGYKGIGPKTGFASFSPDGRRFAIVVSKGNLENNTNDYFLLLFRTDDVFRSAIPKTLTKFASASNDEGISDLSWLEDNETILFLGARGKETTQLYSIRCDSGELKKLTNHKSSLKSYAISANGHTIVYAADKPDLGVINEDVLLHGLHVTAEVLPDLVEGKMATYEPELFVKQKGAAAENRLRTQDSFHILNDIFLSPDGRYLVLKTDTRQLQKNWRQYDDETIRTAFRREIPKGSPSGIMRYELVDTRTSKSELLLDSPAPVSSNVLWSPDSKSVLLCGVYLPLNVDESVELQARRSTKFVVEIELASRRVAKISEGDLRPVRWGARTDIVQFRTRPSENQTQDASEDVYYQRARESWKQLSSASVIINDPLPEVRVEEDLNLPPRIVAVNAKTRRETTLLDLNPQFGRLQFGRVEQIQWLDGTGKVVIGGLYLPADYSASRRYPLVIQTHGFDPHAFWIDGPWSTAFAAQALASRGMAVLQVNDSFYDSRDTPQETGRVMNAYENAIEFLDQKGVIDRSRVGLIGFSRTCLYVKYALTHSRHHYAAAVASDGFDGGYVEYLMAVPLAESEIETVIGASPFGAGLAVWLKNSPGFLLDKVQTPILLEANAPASLFAQWEWFSGLKRLNKPVDLLYLSAGAHILVKPWDRMVSQQGSVDWFCFWLKGEEDSDPEKAGQYARWRELRDQQATLTQQN